MKNIKKIGLGLATLVFLLTLLTGVFRPTVLAVAQPFNNNKIFGGAKYTLNKDGTITTTLIDYGSNGGPTQNYHLVFTDSTPNNASHVYTSDQKLFCAAQTDFRDNVAATITLTGSLSGKTINGRLSAYVLGENSSACSDNSGNISITNANPSTGGTPGLPSTLTYNGNTYSLIDSAYPLYGLNGGQKGNDCYSGSVILTNASATSGTAFLGLIGNGGTIPLNPSLIKAGASSGVLNLVQGCGFQDSSYNTDGYSGSISGGKLNAASPAAQTPATGGTTQTTCEANSNGFSFAWAVCPVMDAASALTNTLLGLFEDQLSFSVGQLGSSTDANSGNYKIHHSWSIIKDIASSLVVIIMLIMVLSQAASFGPFDAYTIRKLLPRLVAVVILMQISWPLFAYTIDLVNDLARGLADIMYLPFGGSSHMDLFSLLANAHLGGVELGVLNWAALAVGVALGIAFLFTMLGIAFTAIVALFFAFLTLVFRKILIIMLLIFSPLALLAWILPGTERYWKMWRENFFKALFMFPILVAIIAGGRVFAYVVGTENNGEFLNLIFILVGFFGPLFVAPRTFKWGGQAMQLAGNGIMKAGNKLSEGPKKFLDKRQEGYSAERQRQSQERYSRGEGFNILRPWRRPLDLIRSGQVDPTLWGRRKEQAMTSYAAHGAESEEADVKAADQRAKLLFDQVGDHDALARAMASGDEGYQFETHEDAAWNAAHPTAPRRTHTLGHLSHADIQAGLNAVAKYGGGTNFRYLDQRVDQLRNGTAAERAMAKSFLDANVGSLQGKMKHLYYGEQRDSAVDSMVDSMSENSFVGMEGAEMEAVLESLSQRAPTDAAAARRLERVLTFYESAINNTSIRPNIGSGVNMAIEAMVDGHNLDNINLGPAHPVTGARTSGRQTRFGMPGINTAAAAVTGIADRVAALHGRIDEFGNIAETTPPAVQVVPTPGTIRIQHQQEATVNLPAAATLTAGSPARDAFKLQLQNDPNAVQILASNIAYGNTDYHDVLAEMRTDAAAAGTPEARDAYNNMIARVQQALQQRVNETAAAAAARGRDAGVARGAASGRLAPQIVDLEPTAPPPAGTPDIRKL